MLSIWEAASPGTSSREPAAPLAAAGFLPETLTIQSKCKNKVAFAFRAAKGVTVQVQPEQ